MSRETKDGIAVTFTVVAVVAALVFGFIGAMWAGKAIGNYKSRSNLAQSHRRAEQARFAARREFYLLCKKRALVGIVMDGCPQ